MHGSLNASVSRLALAACLCLAVRPAAAGLPPSETLFPTTTRGWLSIPDPQGLKERFERSPYGQLVADPAMKQFVETVRAQVSKNGRERLARFGLSLEELQKVAGGEIAIGAVEPQPGRLATLLIVDTTGHDAEARELVAAMTVRLVERKATPVTVAGAPPQLVVHRVPADDANGLPEVRVATATVPGALLVGDDAVQVGQMLSVVTQGRKDSLATLASFATIMGRCGTSLPAGTAPLRWFIDPLGFAQAYKAAHPPREKRKGPDVVAILGRQGFDAVKGMGGLLVFSEGPHALRHHTMIHAPAVEGRTPLAVDCYDRAARMLRFPNAAGIAPAGWVPGGAAGWATLQWDVQAAFDAMEPLVDDVVGEKGVFDDVIASLKEDPDGPQIDVKKDLVDCLGTRLTTITGHVEPIGTDSDRIVIAVEARDEARVAATVAKVMDADGDMRRIEIGGQPAWELIDHSAALPTLEVETPGGAVAHADHDPRDEAHKRRMKLREKEENLLPHTTVAVAKGHLFVASHRDILEQVLAAPAGGGLAAATDYAASAAALDGLVPGGNASRTFIREAETIRPAYELLRQGAMPRSKSLLGQVLNGLFGDGKPGTVRKQRIDGSTLPEFETVRKYLGTAGLVIESLPDGWHIAGLSLPAADAGREMARRETATVGR